MCGGGVRRDVPRDRDTLQGQVDYGTGTGHGRQAKGKGRSHREGKGEEGRRRESDRATERQRERKLVYMVCGGMERLPYFEALGDGVGVGVVSAIAGAEQPGVRAHHPNPVLLTPLRALGALQRRDLG